MYATRLFSHNIDEQLIMRQTDHRSNVVRAYKQAGPEHQMVSDVLQPPTSKGKKLKVEENANGCGGVVPQCSIKENEKENILVAVLPAPKSVSLPGGIVLNFNFWTVSQSPPDELSTLLLSMLCSSIPMFMLLEFIIP